MVCWGPEGGRQPGPGLMEEMRARLRAAVFFYRKCRYLGGIIFGSGIGGIACLAVWGYGEDD